MTIRNCIAVIGIIMLAACYIEQIITVLQTGRISMLWSIIMCALAVATSVAMIVSA